MMRNRWIATVAMTVLMAAGAVAQTAAPQPSSDKDKFSYALGMKIGEDLRKQGLDLDPAILAKAFADAFSSGKTTMTDEEMQTVLAAAAQAIQQKQAAEEAQKAEKASKEGEAFLAQNKAKDGVVTLPSGLQYKVIQQGTGDKPKADDTVVCNYKGTFIDGTVFDASADHGGPASFPVSGVIPGWTEALQLMPVGSKWQLFIPASLAYGENAPPEIGPNATLLFEVELVSIQKPAAPAAEDQTAPK